MEVLIAFDKFKHCMRALEACEIASQCIHEIHPDWNCTLAPLTDGGEGFCEILTQTAQGKLITTKATGPRFSQQTAQIGLVSSNDLNVQVRKQLNLRGGQTLAILEMAQASGIELLEPKNRNPWHTSSIGTGKLLKEAKKQGADAILLGIGGSATNDLGLGALEALGLRAYDKEQHMLKKLTPANWERISSLDIKSLEALPPIHIACDVSNPLIGPRGATYVFAPQKGLEPKELPILEEIIAHTAEKLCTCTDMPASTLQSPSMGAAGGIGFGLKTCYNAQIIGGFNLIWHWLGLEEKITHTDILITGEGRFDTSSLEGKGPGCLVEEATKLKKATYVFAGQIEKALFEHSLEHVNLLEITPTGTKTAHALKNARDFLSQALVQTFSAN